MVRLKKIFQNVKKNFFFKSLQKGEKRVFLHFKKMLFFQKKRVYFQFHRKNKFLSQKQESLKQFLKISEIEIFFYS